MKKISMLLVILIALPLVIPGPGRAIPAFARKYGFNCMMCHTAYPKLNDWGQRFRDNGYQLPGQVGKEKTAFDTPTPIALRTSTGYVGYHEKDLTTGGFELHGLDLLAAGVMHKNISFLLIYTPRIDEPAASSFSDDPSQPGALESASIIFSNIIRDALNIRVGRFEPAYHLFSSKRSYYLMTPYTIYAADTPLNPFVFDDNQIGIEATGHFRKGFKYGVGVVNGTGANPDNNRFKDVYLTMSQTIGAGDGQSAGQRIGVFGYYGRQPLYLCGSLAPTGEAPGCANQPFYRLGAAGSLNWKLANLEVMYMKGIDDKDMEYGRTEDFEYDGAFVELDVATLANNRLVLSGLYNWIKPTAGDSYTSYSALARCYLGDWTAVNVALHAEYTQEGSDFDTDTFAMLVDFGF